jgi:hypothetical protein
MKKVTTLATLIGILFLTISFIPPDFYQTRLESGLYLVSETHSSGLELNQTGKFYILKPGPVINITHIKSTSIGVTPRINGKTYPKLSLNLDSVGIHIVDSLGAVSSAQRQEIGLILNNKLKVVAQFDPFIFSKFEGPSIDIQGDSNDTSSDFRALKGVIDSARY